MKTPYKIIFLILVLCLTACTDRKIHHFPEMEIADRIMISQPDSARKLLVGIKDDIKNENTATKMYYDLLLTHAEIKCNILQTSDSTMQKVVSYYEKHGTKQQLMRAYYLLGCIFYNYEYNASALEYFHKALNIRLKDNKNTLELRVRANEWIGQVYMYQGLFKEALPYFKRSYQYACAITDQDIKAEALRDISRCLYSMGLKEDGIKGFLKAAQIATKDNKSIMYKRIMNELAMYYIMNKEFSKAKEAINSSIDYTEKDITSGCYETWGDLFNETHQLDSAAYYYKKCIAIGNIYAQQASSQSLYFLYLDEKDYKQASEYIFKLATLTNSEKKIELRHNQSLIQSLSKKLQVEKENNRLKVQNANNRLFILLFIALILIIAIVTTAVVKENVRKSKRQKKLLMNTMKELREHSLTVKMENEKEIADMKAQLETLGKEKEAEMQTKILKVKTDMLQKWNDMIDSRREEQELLELELQNSDIYQFFHHNITKTPADNDFTELKKAVDKAYHNFTKRLADLYPDIKEKEMRTCLLVKINLSPTDICNILNISNSGVSMIRSRLFKKIFNKEGSSEEFDRFIKDL